MINKVNQDGKIVWVHGNPKPVCTACGKMRTMEELVDAGTVVNLTGVKTTEETTQ
jgi:hypothetical protein